MLVRLILVVLIAVLVGVASYLFIRTEPTPMAERVTHNLGFTIGVPEGFATQQGGYDLIIQETGDTRTPRFMGVTVNPDPAYRLSCDAPVQHPAEAGLLVYCLENLEHLGQWRFTGIFEPSGGQISAGAIQVDGGMHSDAKPSFKFLLDIVDSIRW